MVGPIYKYYKVRYVRAAATTVRAAPPGQVNISLPSQGPLLLSPCHTGEWRATFSSFIDCHARLQ